MRRPAINILVALLFHLAVSGQHATGQVLTSQTDKAGDSLKVKSSLEKAHRFLSEGKADSAGFYATTAADMAALNGFAFFEGTAYEILGKSSDAGKNWDATLLWTLKAIMVYEKNRFTENESRLLRFLGEKYLGMKLYGKASEYFIAEYSKLPSGNPDLVAGSAERAAFALINIPDDSAALGWYRKAESLYTAAGLADDSERCRRNILNLLIKTGMYREAENLCSQMLGKASDEKKKMESLSLRNTLGYILFRQNNTRAALEVFNMGAASAEEIEGSDTILTDIYTNLGVCYQNLGQEADMIAAFKRALDHSKISRNYNETARISHLLAVIHFRNRDLYHAETYCLDCIEAGKKSGDQALLYECYKTYSEVLESGNDFIKALDYYERYLTVRDSIAFATRLAMQKESDRIDAFEKEEIQVRTAITNDEIRGLELKTLRAESERRENELKLLLKQQELDRSEKTLLANTLALEREKNIARENEVKVRELERESTMQQLELENKKQREATLQAQNQMLERENEQQKITVEKERQIRKLVIWLTVLIILVAVAILYGLVSTRKKNQKLAESKRKIEKINADLETRNSEILSQNEKIKLQKEIIEQKNQSITDSILYASRIQNAVFPSIDFLTDWGMENFIYFKPKDIVSGDFYWGARKGDRIFIAAADCTGHGVPGAFMSMLGHSFLDEIINTTEVTDAAFILNHLRDGIITTLRQKGTVGEARDGMDISLCIIDKGNLTVDFAGANNPLYHIHENILNKIAPDRMPIGIHVTTLSPFTNNHIKVSKGDLLYLFSDGYADQFGGPKGKKFMYKPFQELLFRNRIKPMDLQCQILDNTFTKWMGSHDQVDDVLVIGIKI